MYVCKLLVLSLFIFFKDSVSELLVDISMPSETEEDLIIIVGPEKKEAKLPLEACTVCLPPTDAFFSSQDLAEAEQAVAVTPRSEPGVASPLIEVEEPIEEEEAEEEEAEDTAELGSTREQPESETSAGDEPTLVEEIEADVEDEAGEYTDIVMGVMII